MCDALNELFAEELKEADAHGRLVGKQQGGIEMCRKLGLSYDETLSQIKEEYQLTEEQAERNHGQELEINGFVEPSTVLPKWKQGKPYSCFCFKL